MIIWSGYGFLVGIVGFASLVLAELTAESITGDDQFYQEHPWMIMAGMTLASIITMALIKVLPNAGTRVLVDKETGEEVELRVDHSFFFIPLHWWPRAFLVAGSLFWVIG